jgi:hypothetical protein
MAYSPNNARRALFNQPFGGNSRSFSRGRKSIGKPVFQGGGLALGIVQQLSLLAEMVEVIPLRLELSDAARGFQVQAYPFLGIETEIEHGVELLLAFPVPELRTVQQHHAGCVTILAALALRPRAAQHCPALGISGQQISDIADRKYVGIYHHRTPLVTHQLRRQEARKVNDCRSLFSHLRLLPWRR